MNGYRYGYIITVAVFLYFCFYSRSFWLSVYARNSMDWMMLRINDHQKKTTATTTDACYLMTYHDNVFYGRYDHRMFVDFFFFLLLTSPPVYSRYDFNLFSMFFFFLIQFLYSCSFLLKFLVYLRQGRERDGGYWVPDLVLDGFWLLLGKGVGWGWVWVMNGKSDGCGGIYFSYSPRAPHLHSLPVYLHPRRGAGQTNVIHLRYACICMISPLAPCIKIRG